MRKFLRKATAALGKWAKGLVKTAIVLAAVGMVGASALPASAASNFERCAKAEAESAVIDAVCVGPMAVAAPACKQARASNFLEPVSATKCVEAAAMAALWCPIDRWKVVHIAAHC